MRLDRELVLRELEHAAHGLPAQAPLDVFVHHNTLHAYEHLRFDDAIGESARHGGGRGWLPMDTYRRAYRAGRIRDEDLDASIAGSAPHLGAATALCATHRTRFTKEVLIHDIRPLAPAQIAWRLDECEADRRFLSGTADSERRSICASTVAWLRALSTGAPPESVATQIVGKGTDVPNAFRRLTGRALSANSLEAVLQHDAEAVSVAALWTACRASAECLDDGLASPAGDGQHVSLRNLFIERGLDDPHVLADPSTIAICASFLDRGQSHWDLPDRELGLFEAWARLQTSGKFVRPAWLADLGERLRGWRKLRLDALAVCVEVLEEFGAQPESARYHIEDALLGVRGWAGMFRRIESSERSATPVALSDFLAVRLALLSQAVRDVARRAGFSAAPTALRGWLEQRPRLIGRGAARTDLRAWPLFWLAQTVGLGAHALTSDPSVPEWLLRLLTHLDDAERSRLWHEAWERRYRESLLETLSASRGWSECSRGPVAQVITCIDDREESLRRHVEAADPRCETFGVAGFFNLAIAFRGIDDPSTFPLCPVVVEPQHRVMEVPLPRHEGHARVRDARRRSLGYLSEHAERASRSLILGPLWTALAGALAAGPLLVEIFTPRLAAQLRALARGGFVPDVETMLSFPAARADVPLEPTALLDGFSLDEKAERVATLLENMGLTARFAPVVAVLGHDSGTVNNPHFAAYSCGACGGRSGGPNARLFARMANRPEVRDRLRARGIDVPGDTVFVGGVHDTCSDRVSFYDTADLSPASRHAVVRLERTLDAALDRNARERSLRFDSAPRRGSDAVFRAHVETRAVDLSEPRPELGHATNAACVIGRRALTRGRFLDRRAFLVSYDPTIDASGLILERLLLAVVPVCAGINLEYFFSATDNQGYGAGTKLPHNVTALVGVMDGVASDLRTGLPGQMVEVHEPIRLHIVIERDVETIETLLGRQPELHRLVANEWVRLIAHDLDRGVFLVHTPGSGFVRWVGPETTREVAAARGHSPFSMLTVA